MKKNDDVNVNDKVNFCDESGVIQNVMMMMMMMMMSSSFSSLKESSSALVSAVSARADDCFTVFQFWTPLEYR